MKDQIEKLSAEVQEKFLVEMATKEVQDLIAKTKSATDSGTFEVVISTDNQDRQGEIIDQSGWDFSNYLNNPIVLWAHDYSSLPIGITDSIEKKGNTTVAKGRFAPEEANPFAQQVRKLYDAKIVRTTSVGLIAREMQDNVVTKAELLEFSFVPVPANPYALSLRKATELGLNTEMLVMKGLQVSEKAEGDVCTLDDGTDGVMGMNADGEMVCMPKPAEKEAEKTEVDTETKGQVADEIATDDAWEAKWQNLEEVSDIVNAFYDVYLDEVTPVESFSNLLAETVALLGDLASGGVAEKSVQAKVELKDARHFVVSVPITDAVSREKISNTINGLKAAVAAYEEALKGSEEGENSDGESPKQRSSVAGSDELLRSVKSWSASRQVLRLINNITSDALRDIKNHKGNHSK